MEITDIIGKGKQFEAPFMLSYIESYNDICIVDSKGNKVLFPDDIFLGNDNECDTFAQHLCDLLNREHGEKGNQRYQLLSQCCDVVRNTNLSEDIKSHLINTFMRL